MFLAIERVGFELDRLYFASVTASSRNCSLFWVVSNMINFDWAFGFPYRSDCLLALLIRGSLRGALLQASPREGPCFPKQFPDSGIRKNPKLLRV